jgi:hypothetical protein
MSGVVYSIFGINVDRSHVFEWLFLKKKTTLHALKGLCKFQNALEQIAANSIENAGLDPPSFREIQRLQAGDN